MVFTLSTFIESMASGKDQEDILSEGHKAMNNFKGGGIVLFPDRAFGVCIYNFYSPLAPPHALTTGS